jgi:hypothetical protein
MSLTEQEFYQLIGDDSKGASSPLDFSELRSLISGSISRRLIEEQLDFLTPMKGEIIYISEQFISFLRDDKKILTVKASDCDESCLDFGCETQHLLKKNTLSMLFPAQIVDEYMLLLDECQREISADRKERDRQRRREQYEQLKAEFSGE